MSESQIAEILGEVLHPGKQSRSIVELGMVKEISQEDGKIKVTLGFGPGRDPLQEYLIGAARAALIRGCKGYETSVEAVAVKPRETAAKKKQQDLNTDQLKGIKRIIGIASGKGGVGKSTVSVNLACALARAGYKVGLADADIYGPSVPTMTGTEGAQPLAEESELMYPIEKFGVKWMSVGYFAGEGQALIWRGPMACSALKQMILQVKWGELDFLLIDMPPGTGDIHITLAKEIPMDAVIVVTTPGKVATEDVLRGINLFRNDNVGKRILGVVENMSWFTPEAHPDEKYFIFGSDGGKKMAQRASVELLAQIPLVQSVCESGDKGVPVALSNRPDSLAFLELAAKIADQNVWK